ncbi:MAG: His-Xaa-Ser system protein HxsD [Candidatus Portnoybacteria bacterium]|nr:His-Xaa-Ser system protein HxsD [Candidatus Portnoybacteria bacterium]
MNEVKIKNNTIKFLLNLQDYPLEAVYGTAYVFLDKAYLFLDSRPSKKIEVFLKGKKKLTKKQLENLKGEFLNELLNYTLRINLAKHNRKIREYIVGQALFSAVSEEEVAKEDEIGYENDPLGIAIPWEEKYGQESKTKTKRKKKK